jgi:hypothetical protein
MCHTGITLFRAKTTENVLPRTNGIMEVSHIKFNRGECVQLAVSTANTLKTKNKKSSVLLT